MLNSANDVLKIFVDEAGDPTLFANRRRAIVGTPGCSRFFILGKLEVDDPVGLGHRLNELRRALLANPYFANVPSFDPARDKTAAMFHAKDDVPEVRYEVFKLLVAEGNALRFHTVVCDKEQVVQDVLRRNQTEPNYRYQHNELYDGLMRSLFGKFHRLADAYEVCIARRGQSDRNEALRTALDHAERDFASNYGFARGGKDVWRIRVSTPKSDPCLQAVDYFLWAMQRFFEPRSDPETGVPKHEERFLNLLWPQIGEIHDLHFGPSHGTFFNAQRPLNAETRFGKDKRKKP
ncbi:MAG: DUF3800 domain-containing protein [Rhodocyclales bacterium]|nr:DUF3800 domain-containing protein [Rhodocyclales bacterium]